MATPCINGCVMCGFCCIALTIDDEKLQKPAFKKCQNLYYEGRHALCRIHDERQPNVCRDYAPESRFRLTWFDDRLKYYRQNDYILHLLWLQKHNYLDHLPVIRAIRNFDYSMAPSVFKYLLKPHLIAAPQTVAAGPDWIERWHGLTGYLHQAPQEVKEQWLLAEKEMKNLPQARLRQILT